MMQTALQVFPAYFFLYIKRRLAFPYEFMAGVAANLVTTALGMLFVVFLIDGKAVPNLQGWERKEVLFVYGFSMLPLGIFGMFSQIFHGFSDRYVMRGELDRILLRPISPWCQIVFESFNIESVGVILAGVIAVAWSGTALNIEWTISGLAWLIISALSGAIILMAVFTILCSLAFFFQGRHELQTSCFHLLMLSRYPLSIFSGWLQFLLTWILPYGFISYYPSVAFFSRENTSFYCHAGPLVALISAVIAAIVWQSGLKRYDSAGN